MVPEIIHARHLVELDYLKRYMEELGLESKLVERSEEVPLNTLLTALKKDYKGRERSMNFSYIPLLEEEFEYINLLQLYAPLPCDLNLEYKSSLERFLLTVNGQAAIGHFNLKKNNEIFLRYVHITSQDELINQNEIKETVMLFIYMQEIFGESIEDVASGKKDLQTALRELSES